MLDANFVKKQQNWLRESFRRSHNYSATAKRRGIKLTKFDIGDFIAWDGEGLQKRKNIQVYGLLANSRGDYITNVKGISTLDCLNFLTSNKYPKHAIHVCFGASYDVNMMLRDLPEDLLIELHKGDHPVHWEDFELEYRPRKSFTVRKYKYEIRNGVKYKCYDEKKNKIIFERTVTLWDVFGFFQKRFVDVLVEWTANTKYEEKYQGVIQDIIDGKEKRGNFSVDEMESFVLPYCLNECEALEDIMHILHGYLIEAGLRLSRWDGAGAIAAAALKKYGIKKHIRTGIDLKEECYPQEIIDASEYAYFGGWIEAYYFGHFDMNMYHYDIRSAYPSATVDLPSLAMGHWTELDLGCNMLQLSDIMDYLKTLPSYWIAHIEWSGGSVYGPCPFSWRNDKGSVTRPVRGRGWQWSPEILAVHQHMPKVTIQVDKLYYFVPDENNVKPFAFVAEAYELRKRMKDAKRGVEKVLKLYLNSIYGKLAQSLGYNKERNIKPPFHCLIYAGLITSITRAKIVHAVMQNPMAIASVATDGIYSMAPLDLDIGENLGQWEYTLHSSMTLVQPGFYWYETTGKGEQHYYRGFDKDCVKRQDVIDAYRQNKDHLTLKATRFVTLGAAMGLHNFREWRKWRTKKRELDLVMAKSSKRIWRDKETFPGNKDVRIARNRVYEPTLFMENPDLLESKKYKYDWDEDRELWDGQSVRTIIEEMANQELIEL